MFELKYLFLLVLVSGWSYWSTMHYIKCMISEIGINDKYYPKSYITPPKKYAKYLKITHRPIPKFLYYNARILPIYVIIFGVSMLGYLIMQNGRIVGGSVLLQAAIALSQNAVILVGSIKHKPGKSLWF